ETAASASTRSTSRASRPSPGRSAGGGSAERAPGGRDRRRTRGAEGRPRAPEGRRRDDAARAIARARRSRQLVRRAGRDHRALLPLHLQGRRPPRLYPRRARPLREAPLARLADGLLRGRAALPLPHPARVAELPPALLPRPPRRGRGGQVGPPAQEGGPGPQMAIPWLRRMFGDAAYRVIWEPLMRFKFAEHAPEISAAWIWARMVRLSRSRRSA